MTPERVPDIVSWGYEIIPWMDSETSAPINCFGPTNKESLYGQGIRKGKKKKKTERKKLTITWLKDDVKLLHLHQINQKITEEKVDDRLLKQTKIFSQMLWDLRLHNLGIHSWILIILSGAMMSSRSPALALYCTCLLCACGVHYLIFALRFRDTLLFSFPKEGFPK